MFWGSAAWCRTLDPPIQAAAVPPGSMPPGPGVAAPLAVQPDP